MLPKNQLKNFCFWRKASRTQKIAKTWVKTKIFVKTFAKTKTFCEIFLKNKNFRENKFFAK
jgi:hypothetical protein